MYEYRVNRIKGMYHVDRRGKNDLYWFIGFATFADFEGLADYLERVA